MSTTIETAFVEDFERKVSKVCAATPSKLQKAIEENKMTNTTQKIDDLQKQIDTLRSELEKPQEIDYSTWWPEDYGEYWHYASGRCLNITNNEGSVRASRRRAGGIFATAEDRDTFVRVNERYYELMDGVVLDWGYKSSVKYYFYWCHNEAEAIVDVCWAKQAQGTNYMTEAESDIMTLEFTQAELKLWVLEGAQR